MKAFVTGGTGFVGSAVVDLLLNEGCSVRLFSRSRHLPDHLRGRNVELATGDLADARAVLAATRGADVVFHIGEIRNTTRNNARSNLALMEALAGGLAAQGVRRIVFISSISVSGIPSQVPADETTPPRVILRDHYTEYKRDSEAVLATMRDVEYVILRPAPVYGPGSRYLGLMVAFLGAAGRFAFPFPEGGRSVMPLIHVQDLAHAIVRGGTEQSAANNVFVISDGLGHTWADFFRAVASAQGKQLRIIPIPAAFARFSAPFVDLAASVLGMSSDLAGYTGFFTTDLLFDTAKARRLLGWSPRRTDLEREVQEMVRSYQAPAP